MMRKVFGVFDKGVMVDIGCGNGAYAIALNNSYLEYYGLEPSAIPEGRRIDRHGIPANALLIHYSTDKGLPLHSNSVDTVALIASYDHIPDPAPVMRECHRILKSGGHMVIIMQNFGFWVKRFVNLIAGNRLFRNEQAHFCAHTPKSLEKEVSGAAPFALESVWADFSFLPNVPRQLQFLYGRPWIVKAGHTLLKAFFGLLPLKHLGSSMIVVFRKPGKVGCSPVAENSDL